MKVALLLCLLGLALAAEAHKGFTPEMNGDQIVAYCIKRKGCAAKPFKPVCALNWASLPTAEKPVTGGFPNACYLECANANPSKDVQWVGLFNYRVPRFCQAYWLGIPECSLCGIAPKDPVVPPHKQPRNF